MRLQLLQCHLAMGIFQLHYNLLGPPSHMCPLIDWNIVFWCMTVLVCFFFFFFFSSEKAEGDGWSLLFCWLSLAVKLLVRFSRMWDEIYRKKLDKELQYSKREKHTCILRLVAWWWWCHQSVCVCECSCLEARTHLLNWIIFIFTLQNMEPMTAVSRIHCF